MDGGWWMCLNRQGRIHHPKSITRVSFFVQNVQKENEST